jgi:hypothetical protein
MKIQQAFDDAAGQRHPWLNRVKEMAAFTIPSIYYDRGIDETAEILRPYQSLGAEGVSNLVSKLLISLFPAGASWFVYKPSARARAATVPDDQYQLFLNFLQTREILVQAMTDSTNYRSKFRTVLEQILVAGQGLAQVLDDYKLHTFDVQAWVPRRNAAGEVVKLFICEPVAVSDLTPDHLATADLTQEAAEAQEKNHELKVYTYAEQQRNNGWVITQELNAKTIAESEEPVSPYIVAGYQEIPGEHDSRSFIEQKMGDLRSFNGLSKAVLEGMTAAAKMIPVVDETKGFFANDLAKPNMTVVTGRVTGGMVDGIGFVTTNKVSDFQAALVTLDRIEKRLGKSMLLESSIQPTGERVTATQVLRLAKELEGALGGPYAQIADEIQIPYIKRVTWQMERDRLLPPLPRTDLADINITTGVEALTRMMDNDRLIASIQAVAGIPGMETYFQRIKMENVLLSIFRNNGVDIRHVIKSDAEIEQEQIAKAQQSVAMQAAQQAIQSSGNIAEINAKSNAAQSAA